MNESFIQHLSSELKHIKDAGLYKSERIISSPQSDEILSNGKEVINFCANNYLGLCNDSELVKTGQEALKEHGFGMSSVRFICGTHSIHKQLEQKISNFLLTEDTILYSSCFDANGGLFETLLGPEDAVISDALNHASIIDGIRLCKAKRYRYKNNDMEDLERKLKESEGSRFRLICTDGVFSMDGIIADLKRIVALAETYNAMVMVDDSHAVGFMGTHGRGTHEHCDVLGKIDIITGTLGKALGGASGGYTSGRKEIIEFLRQRSRPYLFSNTLAPVITATSLNVLDRLEQSNERLETLRRNTGYFRNEMSDLGFTIVPGEHPIVPVMLGDAKLAQTMADALLEEGIYVIGFSYPVVPKGEARIRVQISAAHTDAELKQAIKAFAKVGRSLNVI